MATLPYQRPGALRVGAPERFVLGLRGGSGHAVQPVLVLEGNAPEPWPELSEDLGMLILRADDLEGALAVLLSTS